ncbi:hypothetical protein TraAM80_04278 [Trypanosoma rangeli]|uniref:Ubiquitin-like domain-containing protein n=1 Tax=Trypanosoma rangeli TaxID=5698 RepID=A0A3R7MP03_TRYRA|nr:uncharacterized protein TraAM80_04278 [Trypanosoma rangeli]RNF05942.1 hypothetical protein TraAM80_04278 [Trypanosoma rangeli]|eukprot:RNF05942.1 hypothetical protein TraAM80_04278 [Trypanosoma rangeli]
MEDKQAFFVQSADGRKFKMVIRGDLGKLSVGKIRRYLKSYGVPDGQLLLHDGVALEDDAVGNDFGLRNNVILQLVSPHRCAMMGGVRSERASDVPPHFMGGETASSAPSAISAEIRECHSQTASSRVLATAATSHIDPGGIPEVFSQTNAASAAVSSSNNNSKNHGNNTGTALDMVPDVEKLRLREEVQRLRQEVSELRERQKSSATSVRPEPVSVDILRTARSNLQQLGEDLGVPLQFDMNLTCVIGTDERHTVLVTFDPATERLYVYSTLLTQLPEDTAVRVKMYELLLEGSLLGREVCGGGIGMSLQNGIVILSTTIPLRYCSSLALREIMPAFVETLGRWRSLINELLE